MQEFTILGEFKLLKSDGTDVTIISHSECGCWAVKILASNELSFD